ncbi:MAG: pyruvate kinase, partial [bacterium]|nr:pyruvate kinase [bacterium]
MSNPVNPPTRTKIIATLGPASASIGVIRDLITAGANVFRLNFSHGDHAQHAAALANVRQAAADLERRDIAVMGDLQGVKIRTTVCANGPFMLETGTTIKVADGEQPSDRSCLRLQPTGMTRLLQREEHILIDDGRIRLLTLERRGEALVCRVEQGGTIADRRGVHLPDSQHGVLPSLTPKDEVDLSWGIANGVDVFALSFVRSGNDVRLAKQFIRARGADTPVIAKLETREFLQELPDILSESFGVMVARGDLGVVMSPETVPYMQKRLVADARAHLKPVIVATQMLETMIEQPQPTRAETSDVANAVFDGVDAVMLSGETAIGRYPVEAVATMRRILSSNENATDRDGDRCPRSLMVDTATFPVALGAATCYAAEAVDAQCIIVYTQHGESPPLVAARRPRLPLYVFSEHAAVLRRLALVWGVQTRLLQTTPATVEEVVLACETALLWEGLIRPERPLVIMAKRPAGEAGKTNFLS